MQNSRQVYLLDPQKLPPETIAVTFAKTSRSPQTFKEIAADLTNEKSAEFHEKWVVGYGHSSVAEHAVLHIAVENISRLAIECLESNRLASYTEKSSRYQKWGKESFYIPLELSDPELIKSFIETNQLLFHTYHQSLPVLQKEAAKHFPIRDDENETAWERRIRAQYVDVARFLLPAAALANVGMTINARALEHALKKMLSHPLEEVRSVGIEIKQVAQENVPTLVKYANQVPSWLNAYSNFTQENNNFSLSNSSSEWCRLVDYDVQAEKKVLAALIYRFGHNDFVHIWDHLTQASPEEIDRLAQLAVKDLQKYDVPLREFEFGNFTFELLMDQGAYFEIKRHRIMTQTAQSLTTELGYVVPKWIKSSNFEKLYHEAMSVARKTYRKIAEFNPEVAAYIVPNAFNRRILLQGNLRALDHLITLRSAANAHFSVRRISQRIAEEIFNVSPLAKHWIRNNPLETWQEIEKDHFDETMCLMGDGVE